MNVSIRMVEGHKIDGDGEPLGVDSAGNPHTFWRRSGQMEIPLDLALKLENEVPRRYEMIDRELAEKLNAGDYENLASTPPEPEPVEEPEEDLFAETPFEDTTVPTLAYFNSLVKDDINDWAAKRDYDLDPGKMNKGPMIEELCRQIKAKTGVDIK